MANRFIAPFLAVVVVLAISPVIFAQTAAQPGVTEASAAASPPDLSGVWGGGGVLFSVEEPPLQPWAREIYSRNRRGRQPGEQGLDELDPWNYCFPMGMTRAMINNPFELIQLPNRILILPETVTALREIHVDGRGHPEGWPFGWNGHSVGKWEGDTLVVDTVGFNDKTWLDRGGTPHSDVLHVVERMRRVNQNTLEIEFLFEDTKAFTEPWGSTKTFQLQPFDEYLPFIECEEFLEVGKYWMHDPAE